MTRKPSPKTKATAATHREFVSRVGLAVRRMGAQSVLTGHAVAARFGLHTTDLEVLDLIFLREQASAGELAQGTGLTSGSVTALIDRLVKAGAAPVAVLASWGLFALGSSRLGDVLRQ
jgi:hypothetical protein